MKLASDHEIQEVSDEIMDLLMEFDSPRDAGSALFFAHYEMIKAAFSYEELSGAIAAVEGHSKLLVKILNEGWN